MTLQPKSGRELIRDALLEEIRRAKTADLQRALQFLEFARDVRSGKTRKRSASRKAQSESWKKEVDNPLLW